MNNKISLPVLALRDIVLFPGTIAPLFIGRKQSIDALQAAKKMGSGEYILFSTQKKLK
jgi:ATP-dependent Lon protease